MVRTIIKRFIIVLLMILALFCFSGCKHEHTYSSTIDREPTCTRSGVKLYQCTECDHSYTATIEKIAHVEETASCTENGKCKNCQTVIKGALGHNYDRAKCVRCGAYDTVGDPFERLSGYIMREGKYDSSDNEYDVTIEIKTMEDAGYVISANYSPDDDEVFFSFVYLSDSSSNNVLLFYITKESLTTGLHKWLFYDVVNEYYIEGIIRAQSFTRSTSLSSSNTNIKNTDLQKAITEICTIELIGMLDEITNSFSDVAITPQSLLFGKFV